MAVGVNLDEHFKGSAVRLRIRHNRLRGEQIVNQNSQPTTRLYQRSRLRQFVRCHAYRIKNITDANGKKLLRLLERGHRHATGSCIDLPQHHVHTFAGFHMRTKTHTQHVHARLHATNIAIHPRHVDDGGGRVDVCER